MNYDYKLIKKVLVLYVGGTIGMKKNNKGDTRLKKFYFKKVTILIRHYPMPNCIATLFLNSHKKHGDMQNYKCTNATLVQTFRYYFFIVLCPIPNTLVHKVKNHPEMHDLMAAENYIRPLEDNELILPENNGVQGKHRVLYQIIEYSPLLDSSNMTCKDWIRIANDIEYHYMNYDGFVVLHGTDTLAYTSSALSFMLEDLKKTVIITGSQIPIFEGRNDAKNNFLSSLLIAGSFNIPEVCVFFANKLFRGNRVTKISTDALNAFDSPNYHQLADVGISFRVYDPYIKKPDYDKEFKVSTELNPNVAVLWIFPTITSEMLESFFHLPLEGVVIQSFGTGNIPSERKDLLNVFRKAVNRNIIIINVTQCSRGTVSISYDTGKVLDEIGIVSGEDMTVEAAFTKLTYVLGLPSLSFPQRIKLMKKNLRGEMVTKNVIAPLF